jgi:hypothetical protein
MSTPGPVLRWLALASAGALALWIGQWAGEAVAIAPLVSYALSFGSVCGLALGAAQLCPTWARRDRSLALAIAGSALVGLGWVGWSGGGQPVHAAIVLAALLVLGSMLGQTVGAAIEQPGHLLFVALVSSIADAASVLHPSGPSATLIQSEQALSLLALPFAFLGTDATPPLLGVGDVVFAALYVACARRHRLASVRTLTALALAFAVTMGGVFVAELPGPARPFLGAAMLIAHPEARRPPVGDRWRGFAVLGLLVALVLALFALRPCG